jgi:hypothetical protein
MSNKEELDTVIFCNPHFSVLQTNFSTVPAVVLVPVQIYSKETVMPGKLIPQLRKWDGSGGTIKQP